MTTLPAVRVPSHSNYVPSLGVHMHTGENAFDALLKYNGYESIVAADVETPGLYDPFTIKCVTFSWKDPVTGNQHCVLLDPTRDERARAEVFRVMVTSPAIFWHNAPFDVIGMFTNNLCNLDHVDKFHDTILLARMAYPDTLFAKKLENLADKVLGMKELTGGLQLAMKAMGYRKKEDWYEHGDIDLPTYRFGAMADTAVTLQLAPILYEKCVERLLDHPFSAKGLTTRAEAEAVIERERITNVVMMRRNARGLEVNTSYLDEYTEKVDADVHRAELVVMQHGLEPGKGEQLITHLDKIGELPDDWPRTKGGKLSFAKDNLEKLQHPLAAAHREVAETRKVKGYLDAVESRSRVTGRLHAQTGILAASATGRMSYSEPALQQFNAEARPIITATPGDTMTSVDWSQIEPVVLANMAGDREFMAPFEAGADLYEPIQRSAGIERKQAKVVLLASMYGQGDTSLSESLGQSLAAAKQIKRQMFAAMPKTERFIGTITTIAETYGVVPTVGGRVMPIPKFHGQFAAYKGPNYTTQGSAYDTLSDSINRMYYAGVSDYVLLAMHDEIVCDTVAAEAVREIMMTPPEFLTRWCGRVPVFRTDAAETPHWASV